MNDDHGSGRATDTHPALGLWIRATSLGWNLGIVLVLLGAVIIDTLGMPESEFIVGTGMGAGVGLLQGRAIRGFSVSGSHGMLATLIGMAVPFVASDLVPMLASSSYSLALATIAGGLLVGLSQFLLLRSLSGRALFWVPIAVTSWVMAACLVTAPALIPDAGPGLRLVLTLLAMIGGGAVLGTASGAGLVWIMKP